jgi:D-aminopeptidase
MAGRPRLRELGVEIGTLPPGRLNALTDVPGVRVGHTTLVAGDGRLRVGQGPVRTGVTAIHPHEGSAFLESVPAAIAVLNGTGEITGRSQVDELGLLESPILLTSTHSVGTAHRAAVEWLARDHSTLGTRHFVCPVVAETFDGFLNDALGDHLQPAHVAAALDGAAGGPVPEGNVGGGTGMLLFGFKGGVGTASRLVEVAGAGYALGVLVQGNTGRREDLLVDGVPVGRLMPELPLERPDWPPEPEPGRGSVIVVIATDAPLSDRQLGRLCRRGMLGLGRVGAIATNTSGDLLLAFSNAPAVRVRRLDEAALLTTPRLADGQLNLLFQATVEATAEAMLNALVAAETTRGRDGNVAHAIPLDRLRALLREHGRLRS